MSESSPSAIAPRARRPLRRDVQHEGDRYGCASLKRLFVKVADDHEPIAELVGEKAVGLARVA